MTFNTFILKTLWAYTGWLQIWVLIHSHICRPVIHVQVWLSLETHTNTQTCKNIQNYSYTAPNKYSINHHVIYSKWMSCLHKLIPWAVCKTVLICSFFIWLNYEVPIQIFRTLQSKAVSLILLDSSQPMPLAPRVEPGLFHIQFTPMKK